MASISDLLEKLENGGVDERVGAAASLSRASKTRETVGGLTRALDDREASVREAVVQALERLGVCRGTARSKIAGRLLDPALGVRKAARHALTQDALPYLLEALGSPLYETRRSALEALYELWCELRDFGQSFDDVRDAIAARADATAEHEEVRTIALKFLDAMN